MVIRQQSSPTSPCHSGRIPTVLNAEEERIAVKVKVLFFVGVLLVVAAAVVVTWVWA
jgi:hypothetical protein